MDTNCIENIITKLRKMRSISVNAINADDVKMYSEIRIDNTLDPRSRVLSMIEQTGNPYVYRDGEVVVKVSFAESGKTLQSCLEDYLTAEVLMNQ